MLPEPAVTLTIPSICDGTVLDCRIYHPPSLVANPRAPPWRRHAAVMAHPYAPLGGCYDDPLVEVVVEQLLRRGFLVGTFNFRGAGRSAGRTSWTAKPEQDDYASFVAFLVYYVHFLDPFPPHDGHVEPPRAQHDSTAVLPNAATQARRRPVLILGGYSYGSMITSQLPPVDRILETFSSPAAGSDAAHIRLRAEHLASKQNLILGSARATILERQKQGSPTKLLGVRIGGDEGGGSPRKSHESFGRRSLSLDVERVRKGMDEMMARARPGHHHREPSNTIPTSPAGGNLPAVADLIAPRPAYLLVSPLVGLVTHLATMSLVPSLRARSKEPREDPAEAKLIHNPTLAVYGDGDGFVAAHKLRAWTKRLQDGRGSQFQGKEIASAGHFWAEEGVLYRMRDLVDVFASGLLADG